MLKIEPFILLAEYQTNTWLMYDDESLEGIIVDPAAEGQELLNIIRDKGLKIKYIIITHGHGDHLGGIPFFKSALDAPVLIHTDDAPMLTDDKKNLSEYIGWPLKLQAADRLLNDGEILSIGKYEIKVIHTPGHTPGCICLLAEKFLISGDTLFEMSIGRTDFPGGSSSQIVKSIREKLFVLPEDTIVFPGHGPRTSIGMEKLNNPFVRP